MAKGTIGLGQFRGKVGGQVLQVLNGKQVVKSYQPVVSNPNTSLQQAQRAKMSLCGQISKFTSNDALVAFDGATKSLRRGAYVRMLMSRATYSQSSKEAALSIPNLEFSSGVTLMPVTFGEDAVSMNGNILVITTGVTGENVVDYGINYIVAIDGTAGLKVESYPVAAQSLGSVYSFSTAIDLTQFSYEGSVRTVHIFACPYVVSNEAAASYGRMYGVLTNSNYDVAAVNLSLKALLTGAEYGNSRYIGSAVMVDFSALIPAVFATRSTPIMKVGSSNFTFDDTKQENIAISKTNKVEVELHKATTQAGTDRYAFDRLFFAIQPQGVIGTMNKGGGKYQGTAVLLLKYNGKEYYLPFFNGRYLGSFVDPKPGFVVNHTTHGNNNSLDDTMSVSCSVPAADDVSSVKVIEVRGWENVIVGDAGNYADLYNANPSHKFEIELLGIYVAANHFSTVNFDEPAETGISFVTFEDSAQGQRLGQFVNGLFSDAGYKYTERMDFCNITYPEGVNAPTPDNE